MRNPKDTRLNDDTARQAFQRAMHEFHRGEPARAAETCRQGLAEAPGNVDLQTLLGVALIGCRQPREALAPLSAAVATAPHFARARENLGQALSMLGRLDEAVDQLQRAAVLDPASRSIPMKLAHAMALRGKGDEADAIYESAFGQYPNRRELAEAAEHLKNGDIDQCAQVCKELLQRDGNDVNALRLLSKVAEERERWRRAEFLLNQVLERAPGFHDARLDLARVYKQQDRIEDALACTEDTLRRSPNHAMAQYLLASLLAVAGRHDESLAA